MTGDLKLYGLHHLGRIINIQEWGDLGLSNRKVRPEVHKLNLYSCAWCGLIWVTCLYKEDLSLVY